MFNFRTVAGNATLSLHAVGAFDLITRLNRPRPGLGRAWEVPDYQHFPQPRLRPGGSYLRSGEPVDTDHVLAALLGMQRLSWEQGVAAQALLDLGRYELVRVLARDAVTRQAPDGRLAEVGEGNLVNGAANAEAVGWAGHAAAYARQLRWLTDSAPRAADGTLFHIGRQVWVDTVYMVVPALPRAAAAVQLAGHRHRLFDPDARLYAHRWDEDAQRLVRAAFWASGNGWVVAALARALRAAPEPDWAAHATDVIDGCLAFRTAGGLFHDVLDDPAHSRR